MFRSILLPIDIANRSSWEYALPQAIELATAGSGIVTAEPDAALRDHRCSAGRRLVRCAAAARSWNGGGVHIGVEADQRSLGRSRRLLSRDDCNSGQVSPHLWHSRGPDAARRLC